MKGFEEYGIRFVKISNMSGLMFKCEIKNSRYRRGAPKFQLSREDGRMCEESNADDVEVRRYKGKKRRRPALIVRGFFRR